MMASPKLESFCCMRFAPDENCTIEGYANEHDYRSVNISYNVLCIVSSVMSICGASYQLIPRQPRRPPRGRTELESMLRQNVVICWLAIADLLASLGILCRSSWWITGRLPMDEVQSNINNTINNTATESARIFCAVSSAWVHFFYICTYFWTLIYAVDMWRLMRKKSCPIKLYHAVCWGIPAVISFIGLFFVYYPSLLRCESRPLNLIPHYLSTYVSLCLVMIANPILYSKTTTAVRQWMYNTGVYTERERAIVRAASSRFRSILVVFYVCWTPNLFNGLLILISAITVIPRELLYAVWHIMAVLNPLQAFLNGIVYRGVGLCYQRIILRGTDSENDNTFSRLAEGGSSTLTGMNADETSPLLHPLDKSLPVL